MTKKALSLVALLWTGSPALASQPAPEVREPRDVPEAPAADAPTADQPAVERDSDGVFAWIEAMEGEVPTVEAVEGFQESADAELAEMALIEHFGGVDVPLEFYLDPVKTLRVDPLRLHDIDPAEFDIPIVVNASVEKWMRYFTGNGRKYYERWLARAPRYRPLMYAELEKAGLPADLVYLSMIESGYNTHAYSHAAAAGLWQFIPSTGRLYDLRVDWWVDERRDPEKATRAALRYLAELNKMFNGDWYLAFAAYNGGPGRVRRAMRESGSSDFWALAEGPHLYSETDNYVPKLLAAAIIGKHPERYGFTGIEPEAELVYDTAHVDGSVELEVLAKVAGITPKEFQLLNPSLRRWATPPEGYDIRIPAGSHDAFVAALEHIPASQRLTFARHSVARGETLSGIAAKYGVSADDVARANRLDNVDRIYVGMSLVIPVDGRSEPVAVIAPPQAASRSARPTTHTVARGDTLSGVAARYGVTQAQLQEWNQLRGTVIQVGQELALGGAEARKVSHVVERGQTLSGIAAIYGVPSADLQRWNGVRDPSHIQVGQTLILQVGEAGWTTYTVRPGDSLGVIASRNACTIAQIQTWNSLSSTVIHPGQELRLRR